MFRFVSHACILRAFGRTPVARGGWMRGLKGQLIFVPVFCHASVGSTHLTDNKPLS